MFRAFSDIAQLLGQMLPPWALALVGVVLALLALPFWLRSIRIKQISGRARRLVRAEGQARDALVSQIFAIAGNRRAELVSVAEQAIRYDQRDVRDRALAALEGLDSARDDLEHLRKVKLAPEKKPVPHPLEVVVRVEGLLEQGMVDTARTRLEEGLRKYPGDPDLMALLPRLDEAERG